MRKLLKQFPTKNWTKGSLDSLITCYFWLLVNGFLKWEISHHLLTLRCHVLWNY